MMACKLAVVTSDLYYVAWPVCCDHLMLPSARQGSLDLAHIAGDARQFSTWHVRPLPMQLYSGSILL